MKSFTILILLFFYIAAEAAKERQVAGCVPIYEDRVFMSATEVTNFSYQEFLSHQKKGTDLSGLLPDTLVWRDKIGYGEPYVEYYFRHPAYRDYPVVGVSKEQAEAFCLWLSKQLTDFYRVNDKSDIDSVVVRLPTKREWMDAAKGGHDYYEYPWEGHDLRITEGKNQGDIRANFVRGKGDYMGIAGSLNDNADVTAPVKSYWPNDYGLYNCAGNVAEMISDDNVAMGGSWRSSGYDIKVTSEMNALEPSSQIGFRYLVEVVKIKQTKSKGLEINKKFVKTDLVDMDSMWVSKYEVSNKLYNLFSQEMKRSHQDTTVWNDQFIYSNWFTCNYRWHNKYADYPAVGMTKADAEAFCSWLTGKLQPFFDYTIKVALPTDKEWEYLASGGLEWSPYPWGGPYIRNARGCLLGNHKYVPDAFKSRTPEGEWTDVYPRGRHDMYGADMDGYLGCAPKDAYHQNGYGLYNIAGNVREMVSDNNEITKGGGWNSIDYYMQITSREQIDALPGSDIGFRYIVKKVN